MRYVRTREVHLDFHTSEHIPYIGQDFDVDAFADTFAQAHVNSVTVFAACHHGWLYYPSQQHPEQIHPRLARPDLLKEQVQALHARDIKAPVYVTVQWSHYLADTRPEWLIRKPDGSHEGGPLHEPGFYQSLCVNTSYAQYLRDLVSEISDYLGDDLDGWFFDIVGIRPCWCAACRKQMLTTGVNLNDEKAVRAFAKKINNRFKREMSKHVRSLNPDATIFYNAGHIGPCTRESAGDYSHFEIESLPSGGWGYLHFPVAARYARTLGIDVMGMTGKFHTSWGDFHSLKNQAALEFECFRMLSYGCACSVGDQLEPRGAVNPATYRLIGHVYKRVEEVEPWARPAKALAEAALLTPENDQKEHDLPDSIMGAVQMLEELALQYDIIDATMPFDAYKLLILPDDLTADAALQAKIEAYVQQGGAVLACAQGGLNLATGKYPGAFGVNWHGTNELYPDFILPQGDLAQGLDEEGKYAIYLPGEVITLDGAKPALTAVAPYFARKGRTFCSHRYTPAAPDDAYPVAARKGQVLLFAHPLFRQYRDNAPHWCKALVKNAITALLGTPMVAHDGPSTLTVSVLEQPQHQRYAAHILHYIPVRKSATIDIIEEASPIDNVTLAFNLPKAITRARIVPEGTELPVTDGRVTITGARGYVVLELT